MVMLSKCSKMKLLATGDSEFHTSGGVQGEAGKAMDWFLNLLISRSFPMHTFRVLSFRL